MAEINIVVFQKVTHILKNYRIMLYFAMNLANFTRYFCNTSPNIGKLL